MSYNNQNYNYNQYQQPNNQQYQQYQQPNQQPTQQQQHQHQHQNQQENIQHNGGSSFLGIDNQTTLFFEAGDFQWCSQLIENIIGDKLLREKLSKNAIEIAEARHSIKKIIDKQISIYENIIFKQS